MPRPAAPDIHLILVLLVLVFGAGVVDILVPVPPHCTASADVSLAHTSADNDKTPSLSPASACVKPLRWPIAGSANPDDIPVSVGAAEYRSLP